MGALADQALLKFGQRVKIGEHREVARVQSVGAGAQNSPYHFSIRATISGRSISSPRRDCGRCRGSFPGPASLVGDLDVDDH
jgi:hypothetical protein